MKLGVTIDTVRSLELDLTGDGRVDALDVRHLHAEQPSPSSSRIPFAARASR
jgi:hypothetical protein